MNFLAGVGRGGIHRVRAAIVIGFVLTCLATLNAQEQTGTIVFYRELHYSDKYYKTPLFCDGAELTRAVSGSYLQITASVGKHWCAIESPERAPTEIEVTPGSAVYFHILVLPGFKRHAVLVSSTLDEYDKHKPKLIALAPSRLPSSQADRRSVELPNNVAPPSTRQADEPSTEGKGAHAPQESQSVSTSTLLPTGKALIYVYLDPHGKTWQIRGRRVSVNGNVVLDENSGLHVGYARYETDPGTVTLHAEWWDNGVRRVATHETCYYGARTGCYGDSFREYHVAPGWLTSSDPRTGRAIQVQFSNVEAGKTYYVKWFSSRFATTLGPTYLKPMGEADGAKDMQKLLKKETPEEDRN